MEAAEEATQLGEGEQRTCTINRKRVGNPTRKKGGNCKKQKGKRFVMCDACTREMLKLARENDTHTREKGETHADRGGRT